MRYKSEHKFHIPVLGIGYSIDTPLKVAKFGISSVISLVDDTLLERLRKFYLEKENLEYIPITNNEDDSRARRITAYLNMVNEMVKNQIKSIRNLPFEIENDLTKYFEMLPDTSDLKKLYYKMLFSDDEFQKNKIQKELRDRIVPGEIDVNIMTKVDKVNFNKKHEILPVEFNDAHAALRGYALSDLESSIIFSAGMNPRLYSYLESFRDFYTMKDDGFRKKIIIKVSDFRSAFIQGKFLAKKGLWVSEFRVESGLNCGGHAFATDGFLLGPILAEFKNRKNELLDTLKDIFLDAIARKSINVEADKLKIDLAVQGGVGEFTEQNFLFRKYGVKSVGWGTPFLLVPDVINVDENTLQKLSAAGEKDLYLSSVSPLGVPFNNLRGNEKDEEKLLRANANKPGSPCPKKFLLSTKEFSNNLLCTASSTYLNKKIADLKSKLPDINDFKREFDKVTEKVCLCVGLTASATKTKEINIPKQSNAVAVCPGPNLAYFSKITNLREMIDHIYGRINLITDSNRPNMFIKELRIYIDYLSDKLDKSVTPLSIQTEEYFNTFTQNILNGINYYKTVAFDFIEETEIIRSKFINELEILENKLLDITLVSE